MSIVINGLKFFFSVAVAGKCIYTLNIFAKYNKIMLLEAEHYFGAFSIAVTGSALQF